ncbi:glycosyltransferase family 4 protein [Leptolyngbya sp. BC1307]|uniref:glycosyltransferase family 4 protein n=1 Tax=Leptolyngbya sp. BC1307 TaxID=2029589 RepID=UPI000EFB2D8F|nr:glycosyltransferase family 4 protein [Leptolyngbya sp. BC1307]
MVFEKPLDWRARVPKRAVYKNQSATTSEPLRLLILTQFFPPDFAATGQLIEELAKQLSRQQVSVSVFTGQPAYAFAKDQAPQVEQTAGVWVKRSRMTQFFPSRIRGKAVNGLLFAIRTITHLIRRYKDYQVLLVTTAPPFLPIIGYLANVFLGLPYVCLLYDLYPDIAIELEVVKANHPIARAWRFINCQIWQRSAGIIVLSPSMKQRIAEHCPAVKDKISVIHSWTNTEQMVPIAKKDNWFAREHRLTSAFVVLYSGNMGRCHDVETILAAAQQLKDDPILFVCVGGGAKRQPLIEAVSAASLTNFLFLPYQEKAVLPYSLTACDLSLVSVAVGMESLVAPSKLYPAMATGRPIVAICPPSSYLGPLLAAAQSGRAFNNGEAEALANYIRYLSQNHNEAERLGESGRRYVQSHFTSALVSQQYLKVLERIPTCERVAKKIFHA